MTKQSEEEWQELIGKQWDELPVEKREFLLKTAGIFTLPESTPTGKPEEHHCVNCPACGRGSCHINHPLDSSSFHCNPSTSKPEEEKVKEIISRLYYAMADSLVGDPRSDGLEERYIKEILDLLAQAKQAGRQELLDEWEEEQKKLLQGFNYKKEDNE